MKVFGWAAAVVLLILYIIAQMVIKEQSATIDIYKETVGTYEQAIDIYERKLERAWRQKCTHRANYKAFQIEIITVDGSRHKRLVHQNDIGHIVIDDFGTVIVEAH